MHTNRTTHAPSPPVRHKWVLQGNTAVEAQQWLIQTVTHARTSSVAVRLSDSITAAPLEYCGQVWPASHACTHQPAMSSNPSPDRKPHVIMHPILRPRAFNRGKNESLYVLPKCMYVYVRYMHEIIWGVSMACQGQSVTRIQIWNFE